MATTRLMLARAEEQKALEFKDSIGLLLRETKKESQAARLAVLEAEGHGECMEALFARAWLACYRSELDDAVKASDGRG